MKQSRKKRSESAKAGAAARWAGKTPEQRSEEMAGIANARPRLGGEDQNLLAWLREKHPMLIAMVESWERFRADADVDVSETIISNNAELEPGAGADASKTAVGSCSVCLGPIYDLDSPCATCLKAGRLSADSSPADLYAAQAATSSPSPAAPIFDAPRVSNAVPARGPIPPPIPPSRVYTPGEVCRACGRLAELHINKGGPIGHVFEQLA